MEGVCSVVSLDIHVTNLDHSLSIVLSLSRNKVGSYVCVSNVHMCMEAFDSEDFRNIVNQADLVIPDGRPLSWAQKLLGHSGASQVRGQDIMNSLCQLSGERSLNIGLYGGSSDTVLLQVVDKLREQYPDILLEYYFSPPFRELAAHEDEKVVSDINQASLDILFVGLGCPKQERWMAQHKDRVNCVMLGVGAAFDFIAGSKNHAPRWMQRAGLEWLFRLCSEPTRLWKRYLKQNPRFIYHFLIQFINVKFLNRRSGHVQ